MKHWEPEVSGRPTRLFLGGSRGHIFDVPLSWQDDFPKALSMDTPPNVVLIDVHCRTLPHDHRDSVQRLCWLAAGGLGFSRPGLSNANSPSDSDSEADSQLTSTRHLLGRSGDQADGPTQTHEPDCLLCSTSNDQCIHLHNIREVLSAAGQDEVRKVHFHISPVRGACVNAQGHLVTADGKSLATWRGLHSSSHCLFPAIVSRDASFTDVYSAVSDIVVTCMQMLHFTIGSAVTKDVSSLKLLRIMCHISTFQLPSFTAYEKEIEKDVAQVTHLEEARTLFETDAFFQLRLGFRFCLPVMAIWFAGFLIHNDSQAVRTLMEGSVRDSSAHVAERRLNQKDKKEIKKRRGTYQVVFGVVFSMMIVPSVESFVGLIDCSPARDNSSHLEGLLEKVEVNRFMDARPEVLCFHGWHLVASIVWFLVMSVYLALCILCEAIDLKLRNVSAIELVAADGTRSAPFGLRETSTHSSSGAVCQMIRVALRQTCSDVEVPLENSGPFTRTSSRASRQISFAVKLLFPSLQVFQSTHIKHRMAFYFLLCSANLVLTVLYPPVNDQDLLVFILTFNAVVLAGSVCSLALVVMVPLEELHTFQANQAVDFFYLISAMLIGGLLTFNWYKRRGDPDRGRRFSTRAAYAAALMGATASALET